MDGIINQNKKTVLFVEDDPIILRMYSTKLNNEGFNVLTAADGITGLEKAESEKVDIIVLDIMMPRMSGIELLARLYEKQQGNMPPVVILTNLTEKEQQEAATKYGAKEVLIKAELLPSDLVKIINKYT